MFEIQRTGTKHGGKTIDAFTSVPMFDNTMPATRNAIVDTVNALGHRCVKFVSSQYYMR